MAAVKRIGIAWRGNDAKSRNMERFTGSFGLFDCEIVYLDEVFSKHISYDSDGVPLTQYVENGYLSKETADLLKSTSSDSNAADVTDGVDLILFSGGADVSPTLLGDPYADTDGCYFGPLRDISEFLLLSYCIDRDLPVLGICRGHQLIGAVSGAKMIPDWRTKAAAEGVCTDSFHPVPHHDITVTSDRSVLFPEGCGYTVRGVRSTHHQAVGDVSGTNLEITAVCGNNNGFDIVEAIQRTDRTFVCGMQFHPETLLSEVVSGAIEVDGERLEQHRQIFRNILDNI